MAIDICAQATKQDRAVRVRFTVSPYSLRNVADLSRDAGSRQHERPMKCVDQPSQMSVEIESGGTGRRAEGDVTPNENDRDAQEELLKYLPAWTL